MPVVEEHIVIPQPPEVVFDFLSRPENVPLWDSSVVKVKALDPGPLRQGNRWRGSNKIMGRRFDWTTEIIEVDAPRTMLSRSVEGKMSFELLYTLTPKGEGTRFTYRIEAESGLGGVFGRFADPLVQSAQARTVRANLERLVELLSGSTVG